MSLSSLSSLSSRVGQERQDSSDTQDSEDSQDTQDTLDSRYLLGVEKMGLDLLLVGRGVQSASGGVGRGDRHLRSETQKGRYAQCCEQRPFR